MILYNQEPYCHPNVFMVFSCSRFSQLHNSDVPTEHPSPRHLFPTVSSTQEFPFHPNRITKQPPMNGFHALISEWMFSWQEQGGEGADALEKRLEERDFSFCSFNSNPAAEPLPQQKRGQHEPKFTELLKVFTHPHAFPPLLLHARTSSFFCVGTPGGLRAENSARY